jgi:hypothetical protein
VTAGGWEEELMELPITISQTIETDNTFDKLVFSVKVKESPRILIQGATPREINSDPDPVRIMVKVCRH